MGKEAQEYELLRLCARTRLREGDRARILELARGVDDWAALVRQASYHQVQPLLYVHLKEVGGAPEAALFQLQQHARSLSVLSLSLIQNLGSLSALLQERGIPFLAFKGAPLALALYGNVALRPFVDIDLVVQHQDFRRLEEVLVQEGYGRRELSPFRKAAYLFIHGQYTFGKRVGNGQIPIAIDVHTNVLPVGYSYGQGLDELLSRAVPAVVGGAEVPTLCPEDRVTVLCYHGFKNRWNRLKYITDVAEGVRTYPELRWAEMLRRAEQAGGRRVLLLGLLLAHDVLDAPVPRAVLERANADGTTRGLADALIAHLPEYQYLSPEPFHDRFQLNWRGQDGVAGRVRYGAYVVIRRLADLFLDLDAEP